MVREKNMAIKRTETFVEQVVKEIKDRINAGVYAPGQRIPSENELSTEMQVSRATARSAYIKLSAEGVVKRIHGDGTYVRERIPDLISAKNGVWDFNNLIENQGYKPSNRGLRINQRVPNEAESKALALSKDDRVISVRRVIYADEDPVFYTQNVYSAILFDQDIHKLDLSLGLYDFTKKYINQELVSVLLTIGAGIGENEIEDIGNYRTNIESNFSWVRLEEIFYDSKAIPRVYGITNVKNLMLPILIGLRGFDK